MTKEEYENYIEELQERGYKLAGNPFMDTPTITRS